jgi:hypothetical protein
LRCFAFFVFSVASLLRHTLTDTVYYGQGNGTFTVTATMTDTLAGLAQVVFPETTGNGQSYALGGAANANQAQVYDFAQSDSFSDTVEVAVTDRAGNVGSESFVVVNDTVPPTATITAPSVAGLRFAVTWAGSDVEAGVRSYEVEFKDGAGDWTAWLIETTQRNAYFRGTMTHTYTFRIKATDNVNNPGEWVESGPVEIATVTKYYTFSSFQRSALECRAKAPAFAPQPNQRIGWVDIK